MNRVIYKILIDNNEVASFDHLEYAMVFIKGICERYYEELKQGFNFTIKEVVDNE